jgi:hypothetical protein
MEKTLIYNSHATVISSVLNGKAREWIDIKSWRKYHNLSIFVDCGVQHILLQD